MNTIHRTITSAAALILLLGCAGSKKVTTIYEGTYVRTWVELNGAVAQATGPVRVELTSDGHYEIEGDGRDHPPHGKGDYDRRDGQILLDDRMPPTAGYDLSLILEGPFEAAEAGSSLVLTQENMWGHTHLLMLERVAVVADSGE